MYKSEDTQLTQTTNGSKNESEDIEHDGPRWKHGEPPTDRGYAWVILIGSTFEMALLIGMLKSSGLLFVAFQEKFHSSSSMTSLVSTVQNICFSLMALFVMTVGVKLTTCRNLVFIGSVSLCVAYIVTSQAQDIRVLLLSHGVLHGCASAFMQPTSLTMIGQYFDKRRGLANSIAVSGGSLGGLIFAPLITNLLSTYGYQGCFLIIAGILLNGCVSAALFRPMSSLTKQTVRNANTESVDDIEETHNLIQSIPSRKDVGEHPERRTNINNVVHSILEQRGVCAGEREHDIKSNGSIKTPEYLMEFITNQRKRSNSANNADTVQRKREQSINRRHRTFTDSSIDHVIDSISHSKVAKYASSEYITGSVFDLAVVSVELTEIEREIEKDGKKIKGCFYSCINIFDYKLFKQPVFLAFIASASCICPGTVLATLYIAPYARDIGVSVDKVATLITVFSAVDLCSRIIVGFISDRGWLRRSTIVSIASMAVSVSAHLLRFYTSYNILVGYAVILGLFSGVYFSLYVVVIVDYMTLEKMNSCIGFTALFHGFSIAGFFYLVGYYRDVTGSYIIPYHVIGATTFIGAIIMLLLPLVERCGKSSKTVADDDIEMKE